ncbi:hypothetical protein ACFO4N_02720 [Camelliibacillus cellulosilyticus]|uniref:Uncharacterized protein n=1 Tax=Camelliibacillus cellulosilyticus TaxID=2174486 RepID=A0ABV9GID2_9BACL
MSPAIIVWGMALLFGIVGYFILRRHSDGNRVTKKGIAWFAAIGLFVFVLIMSTVVLLNAKI